MKKILLLVAAFVCSVTMVFAQDTRIVIDECEFTTSPVDMRDLLKAGDTWNSALKEAIRQKFIAPDGAVYYLISGNFFLQVKNGGTFKQLAWDSELTTTDTYRFMFQVRIDGDNGALYRFPLAPNPFSVVVNGTAWTYESTNVSDTYSFAYIFSPAFTLDSRDLVTSCEFSTPGNDYRNLLEWNEAWNLAKQSDIFNKMQKATGAVYRIAEFNTNLFRWDEDDSSWKVINSDAGYNLLEGKYYIRCQVRVDASSGGSDFRFPHNLADVKVLVDGAEWETSNLNIYDTYSCVDIFSPEFEVISDVEVVDNGIRYDINREQAFATVLPPDDEYKDTVIIPAEVAYESLSYPVKKIFPNAFLDAANLKAVDIPATIVEIGEDAFRNCQNMEFMICRATTPPALGSTAFHNVNAGGAIPLYVPDGNENDYNNADDPTFQWSAFEILSLQVYAAKRQIHLLGEQAAAYLNDCVDVMPDLGRQPLLDVFVDAVVSEVENDKDWLNDKVTQLNNDLDDALAGAIASAKDSIQGDAGLSGDWTKLLYAAKNVIGLDDENALVKQLTNHKIAITIISLSGKTLAQLDAIFVEKKALLDADISALVDAAKVWGEQQILDLLTDEEKAKAEFLSIVYLYQAQIEVLAWDWDKDVETNLTNLIGAATTIANDADAAIKAKRAATGIDEVNGQQSEVRKVFRKGQVYIIRDGKTMNVLGAEVK